LSETTAEKEKSKRLATLNIWAKDELKRQGELDFEGYRLVPTSDDASFRRYFRPELGAGKGFSRTYVFVDAPPMHENNEAYIRVNEMMAVHGLRVPRVYQADLDLGFLMVEDFGDQLCLDALNKSKDAKRVELVEQAIAIVCQIQAVDKRGSLASYDDSLLETEMNLFVDWFVEQLLSLQLESIEVKEIDRVKRLLRESALAQPKVLVHRDFHSRNLMIQTDGELGIIDFQDAVMGPVTYDLVSLLKDCYYRFPRDEVCHWVENFRTSLNKQGIATEIDQRAFLKWFDLMGMQRHLKCAGIFSRLKLRDGKQRYLADIPLVIDYIVETCHQYPELREFGDFLEQRVLPALEILEIEDGR
jgi:aminoglycoside/choline kinase family phosphotransferase